MNQTHPERGRLPLRLAGAERPDGSPTRRNFRRDGILLLILTFGIYSWFRGVEPNPPGLEGMIFLHFLDLDRAWAWQIPLRNGICSIGFIMNRADYRKAGMDTEDFVDSLIQRNRTFHHFMRNARRIRPWTLVKIWTSSRGPSSLSSCPVISSLVPAE